MTFNTRIHFDSFSTHFDPRSFCLITIEAYFEFSILFTIDDDSDDDDDEEDASVILYTLQTTVFKYIRLIICPRDKTENVQPNERI